MVSLADIITENEVAVDVQTKDWREAIKTAGELLVREGAVAPSYVNAMIRIVEELGPYIIVAPGVAMPHARPEDGALKVAISIVKLREAVIFPGGEDNPINLILALAALDKNSHVQVMASLADILNDDAILMELKVASSKKDILDIIKKKS